MIPRIKPYLNFSDLRGAISNKALSAKEVEQAWARRCGSKYALLLPYGRSALYFLLKANRIADREILLPAYICDVLIGPVIESGNRPVLVDSRKDNFNVDEKRIEELISPRTGAVVAAAMYGQPIDPGDFRKIKKKGVVLIADYALGLFSYLRQEKRELLEIFDLVFFSFGIGKEVTCTGGGLMLTDNASLYERIKSFRDMTCRNPGLLSSLRTLSRFLSALIFFYPFLYRLTYWLSEKTSVLNKQKGILEERLPADFFEMPSKLQMHLARERLNQLDELVRDRTAAVEFYSRELDNMQDSGIIVPLKNRSLSQFPVLLRDGGRDDFLVFSAQRNIHISKSFNKAIHKLPPQKAEDTAGNALRYAESIAVLPIYYGIRPETMRRVASTLRDWIGTRINEHSAGQKAVSGC